MLSVRDPELQCSYSDLGLFPNFTLFHCNTFWVPVVNIETICSSKFPSIWLTTKCPPCYSSPVKWNKVKSLSCVWPFVTPWTVTYQPPPSMGFSRQEYWSELPFPSPGDLPELGIKPPSPKLQRDTLLSEPSGKSSPVRSVSKLT